VVIVVVVTVDIAVRLRRRRMPQKSHENGRQVTQKSAILTRCGAVPNYRPACPNVLV
jgi:hypothetical protein